MHTTPRTERGRATRERILQAATELIAARGVANTSLDDVRERAHASKSQLYLYFADRDALLRAVAQHTADTVLAAQTEHLAGFDSLDGITRYLDAVVARQEPQDARAGCPLGTLCGQLADSDEATRLALMDGLDRWEDALRTGLQAMSTRGELRRDADPAQLATQTLALLQGGLLLTQVRHDPQQIRTATDGVLALVRSAMTAPRPRPAARPPHLPAAQPEQAARPRTHR